MQARLETAAAFLYLEERGGLPGSVEVFLILGGISFKEIKIGWKVNGQVIEVAIFKKESFLCQELLTKLPITANMEISYYMA